MLWHCQGNMTCRKVLSHSYLYNFKSLQLFYTQSLTRRIRFSSFIYVVFFGTCEKRDKFCSGGDGKYSKIEFSHARIFVLLNHPLLLCQHSFAHLWKDQFTYIPFKYLFTSAFLWFTHSLSHTYTQSHHVLLSSLFFLSCFLYPSHPVCGTGQHILQVCCVLWVGCI